MQLSEVNNIETEVANHLAAPAMQSLTLEESSYSIPAMAVQSTVANVVPSSVEPSECATCAGGDTTPPQIVYALGKLGTDFLTEARQDSFTQAIPPGMTLIDYLNQNPYEAQSLIWTLSVDATPIYAIVPVGAYAFLTWMGSVKFWQTVIM